MRIRMGYYGILIFLLTIEQNKEKNWYHFFIWESWKSDNDKLTPEAAVVDLVGFI